MWGGGGEGSVWNNVKHWFWHAWYCNKLIWEKQSSRTRRSHLWAICDERLIIKQAYGKVRRQSGNDEGFFPFFGTNRNRVTASFSLKSPPSNGIVFISWLVLAAALIRKSGIRISPFIGGDWKKWRKSEGIRNVKTHPDPLSPIIPHQREALASPKCQLWF